MRKRLLVIGAIAVVLVVGPRVRKHLRAPPPRPDEATFAQAERVEIVRDTYGVPHVYGKSDGDAAFGLAYANAEDDWPTVQGIIAASTGRLGIVLGTKKALENDYYWSLVRVKDQVDAEYDGLSAEYREVLEGYARGLNLYAYLHPGEADGRIFPLSGRDVAAGFAHKMPLMFDLPDVLGALLDGKAKRAGDVVVAEDERSHSVMPGSNAHAVSGKRSPDGITRLNVNSHQPWEGPVTWYEAQVVSEQGWNMTGGTFPGAPMILHGHNEHLGWAHTVNTPDLIDVYLLEGEQAAHLEERQAPLTIDLGLVDLTVHKAAYWAKGIGPAIVTSDGVYAIRWAGMGRALKAGEQWWRMNKARSFAEWKDAMRLASIPMFNTAYADRENVFYVYNALLPKRAEGHDWKRIQRGDDPSLVWNDYLPWDELPHVENPESGFVQTCNSTPYATTLGPENPSPETFSPTFGIETNVTNRAARSLALLGASSPIDRAAFLRMKWDRTYAPTSAIFHDVVKPVLAQRATFTTPDEKEAILQLSGWDGIAADDSVGATLAILTWRKVSPKDAGAKGATAVDPSTAFRQTVQWLVTSFGEVDVPLSHVQRLRHGTTDLPLGGGPDVINAVVAHDTWDGRLVGYQGDSYVLEVEFGPDGATSRSVHQYGASVRNGSPHYSDQAKLYLAHELKPTWRTPAELAQHTERRYHPGH
jgi:penicillin amidase/acyl-homoserine-lactone acylase